MDLFEELVATGRERFAPEPQYYNEAMFQEDEELLRDDADSEIIRADANLVLTEQMNTDAEPTFRRVSRETGVPVGTVRALDNRELSALTRMPAKDMPRSLRSFVSVDDSNAALVAKDLPAAADVASKAESVNDKLRLPDAFSTKPTPGAELEAGVHRYFGFNPDGYDPKQIAFAKTSTYGWLLAHENQHRYAAIQHKHTGETDEAFAHRVLSNPESFSKFEAISGRAIIDFDANDAILPSDDVKAAPGERLTPTQQSIIRQGTEVRKAIARARMKEYMIVLRAEITAMKKLQDKYGDAWREFDDTKLREALVSISPEYGNNFALPRFRKKSNAGEVGAMKPEKSINPFGLGELVRSAYYLGDGASGIAPSHLKEILRGQPVTPERVQQLLTDPNRASDAELLPMVELLEQTRDQYRGATFGTLTQDAIVSSLNMALETMLLKGFGGKTSATASAASKWGKVFKNALAYMGLKAPQNWNDATWATGGQGEDFAVDFTNRTLLSGLSMVVEQGGEQLPGLVSAFVSKLPPSVRNNFVSAWFQKVMDAPTYKAFQKAMATPRAVGNAVGFSGFVPEVAEEYIERAIQVGSTELAQVFNTEIGNFGQTELFGTPEEMGVEALTILTLGGLFSTVGAVTSPKATARNFMAVARSFDFKEAHTQLKASVDASNTFKADKEGGRDLLRTALGSNSIAYLSAEDALTLYQTQPEAMQRIGVNEDVIAAADGNGTLIPVDMTFVHTELDAPEAGAVIDKSIPNVEGKAFTADEASKIDLSSQAVEVAKARVAEAKEVRTELTALTARMRAAGRSEQEVRNLVRILANVAGNFSLNVNEEGKAAGWSASAFLKRLNVANVSSVEEFRELLRQEHGNVLDKTTAEEPHKGGELYQAKVSPDTRAYLKVKAAEKNLSDNPVIAALLGDTDGFIETRRGRVEIPFDGGGLHSVARHLIETGKAETGGVTLEEVAEALPKTHSEGRRVFEKSPKVGRKLKHGKDEVGRAVYRLELGGKRYKLVTAVSASGIETLVSFSSNMSEKDTKRATQSAIPENKARTLLESRSEDNIAPDGKKSSPSTKVFQQAPSGRIAGAFDFDAEMNGLIGLFSGEANVDTVIHETGHYVVRMMGYLVSQGFANQKMVDDLNALHKFAAMSDADAQSGYAKYLETKPEAPESFEQWRWRQQQEKLADAFLKYILEGKAPSMELQSAFSYLRKTALNVYKYIRNALIDEVSGLPKHLNFTLNEEVREVFDGLVASSESAVEMTPAMEVASELDLGLLGLSKEEMAVYTELLEKAYNTAFDGIAAEKDRALKELLPQWRKEAREAREARHEYQAWEHIEGGQLLDFVAVAELMGEDIALRLLEKGLTTAHGRRAKEGANFSKLYPNAVKGAHPADVALEVGGYGTAEQMLNDLYRADTPKRFDEQYVAEMQYAFHQQFEADVTAPTVTANLEVLDRLGELIAGKAGASYGERRAALADAAKAEIDGMRLGDILTETKIKHEATKLQRQLVVAVNKQDWDAALETAAKLRGRLEVMKRFATAKKTARKLEKSFRDLRRRKTDSVHGDYLGALRDLAVRFGFSKASVDPQHTAAKILDRVNRDLQERGLPPWEVSEWLLSGSIDYKDLTPEQARELQAFHDFLLGEGRAEVGAAKQARRDAIQAKESALLDAAKNSNTKAAEGIAKGDASKAHKADSTADRLRGMTFTNSENFRTLLLRMCGDDVNHPAMRLVYDELAYMASRYDVIRTAIGKKVRDALKALETSSKQWYVGGVTFAGGIDAAYVNAKSGDSTAEKLLMACLNMGTARNRAALMNGFGWDEATLDNLASRLSAEDWANIQAIWDALDELAPMVAEAHRKAYHCDLQMEDAVPVTVHGQTFRGGYLPLSYMSPKAENVEAELKKNRLSSEMIRPSFTHQRTDGVENQVNLSLSVLHDHVQDAAHFITYFNGMRNILAAFKNSEVRKTIEMTQGFDVYNAMKKELTLMADPTQEALRMVSAERRLRALASAVHIAGSPVSIAMQYAASLIGVDEIEGHRFAQTVHDFARGVLANPRNAFTPDENGTPLQKCLALSGFMRDRFQMKDIDMRQGTSAFAQGLIKKGHGKLTNAGYLGLRVTDMTICVPLWCSMFDQSIAEGYSRAQAVAKADDFVARSQGSTRTLEITPVQMSMFGRLFAMYFSGVNAQFNTMVQKAGIITHELKNGGKLRDVAGMAFYSILSPLLLAPIIRYIAEGGFWGDDDERAEKAALRELLTGPLSGVAGVREISDAFAWALTGSSNAARDAFTSPSISVLNDTGKDVVRVFEAAFGSRSGEEGLYYGAKSLGAIFQLPVVQIYDRLQRLLTKQTGDEVIPKLKPEKKRESRKKKTLKMTIDPSDKLRF